VLRYGALQYDTIYLRALNSRRYGQLNLGARQKKRKLRKIETKTESRSEETVRAIVREGSPEGETETTGGKEGFVKQVGFKPALKVVVYSATGERKRERRVMNERRDEVKKEVISEGRGESEIEKLVPE